LAARPISEDMMLTLLLVLTQQQQPTAPPPPPQRYRVEVSTYNELDRTAIGQPKLEGGLSTTALITVTMIDSTNGAQIAVVRVDSIGMKPSGVVAEQLAGRPTAAQDAKGATARALIVRGHLAGLPRLSDSTNPALSPITQAIGVLFPAVRRDAKVGQSWADTNHLSNTASNLKQTGEIIVTWTATGVATGGGIVLDGVSSTHTRTEDTGQGQVMVLSSRSKQHVVIGPSGPVRQAAVETSGDTTISGTFPGTVPGKSTGSLTVTPIP
jgi:hypothetical protein